MLRNVCLCTQGNGRSRAMQQQPKKLQLKLEVVWLTSAHHRLKLLQAPLCALNQTAATVSKRAAALS